MNIFVTDKCPKISAQILDDGRVNKMIIESLQMMAYAIARHSDDESALPLTKDDVPYKVGGNHKKHPCSIWAGNNRANYNWLLAHTIELIKQKKKRFPDGKGIDSYTRGVIQCHKSRHLIPAGKLQEFQNSSEHKGIGDTVFAYRLTMVRKWEIAKSKHTHKEIVKMMRRIGLLDKKHKLPSAQLPKWSNCEPPHWYAFFKNNNFNYMD